MTPEKEIEFVGIYLNKLSSDMLFSDFSVAKGMPASLKVVRSAIQRLVEDGKVERVGLSHRRYRNLYRRIDRIIVEDQDD